MNYSFPIFNEQCLFYFSVTLPNPLLLQTTKLVFGGKMSNPQSPFQITARHKHDAVDTAALYFDAVPRESPLSLAVQSERASFEIRNWYTFVDTSHKSK